MSEEEREPQESHLMDALLRHSLAPDTEAENEELRIRQLMSSLRDEADPYESGRTENRPGRPSRVTWTAIRRWIIVPATTALILIGWLLLPSLISEQRALATVERSLAAEQKPLVRQYQVTLVADSHGANDHPYEFDLFVKQREFVIRAPALRGEGVVWMGGNQDERWIVPRFGPVLTGSEGMLGRWSRRRRAMATPFLRTAAILQRLQRFYDLEMRPPVQLEASTPGGSAVDCDHVIAIRREDSTVVTLPDRVELWADRELGFARKMRVEWSQPAKFGGLTSAVVSLSGTPEVASDFFSHSGHHDGEREVIAGASGDAAVDE